MSVSTGTGTTKWSTFDTFMGETPAGVRFLIVHEVSADYGPHNRCCHRVRVDACPAGWPRAQTFTGENPWRDAQVFMEDLKDFLLWSEHPEQCDC